MSRKALFDFARPLAPGGQLTAAMVSAGDAFADALGLPREGAAGGMLAPPAVVNAGVVLALKDPAAFFAALRAKFGPLSQSQVDGINFKLKAMARWPVQWVAYGLATSWHETAKTLQPIEEYGKGRGRKYGVPGPHGGQIAYGRGDVQLTWPENYALMDRELGLNGALIADYNKALDPDISARIMVHGMENGRFTGKGLKSYPLGDYANYRRIINGTDKADLIAGHARGFEAALEAGGW